MFAIPRLLLIVFLGILQLFAPFMHAHASENATHTGLHIPGLEVYGEETAQLSNLAEGGETDCDVVVMVDAGIKPSYAVQLLVRLDNAFSYGLSAHATPSDVFIIEFKRLIYQYTLSFIQRPPPDIHGSRAPPPAPSIV